MTYPAKSGPGLNELLVGVSALDVTPELETPLGGYAHYRPASTVHSRLKAKCMVVQSGNNSVLIVVVDAFAIPNQVAARVRLRIAEALGVPADSVLVAASHTHSAPDTLGFASLRNRQLAQKYLNMLEESIIEVAGRAWANRFKAQAHTASGKALVGFNRVNWGLTQPLYRTLLDTRSIRYFGRIAEILPALPVRSHGGLIGPVDPNVNMMWFESNDSRGAVLVNYACHPTVLGRRSQVISGDYPSVMTDKIEETLGQEFVVLFTNGASGNINPRTCWGYRCDGAPNDVEHLGRVLADEVLLAMRSNSRPVDLHLDHHTFMLNDPVQIQIQVIHIGDWAIVAVPGELFVETGLEMQRRAWRKVLVVGYANGYVGYLPPDEAFRSHCRETEKTWWNMAPRGAAEEICSSVANMELTCDCKQGGCSAD